MDIAVVWDTAQFRGDWDVTSGDLATDAGLESLVLILLGTDGLAPASFVPPDGTQDRRGHWSDTYEADPSGSLLWTYNRSGISNLRALLNALADACRNALQVLVKYGIAASVSVTAERLAKDSVFLNIAILKPGATAATKFQYNWAWAGL